MKAQKWVLVQHFNGEPKDEDLQLTDFEISDNLNENGTFIHINEHSILMT